MFFTKTLIHEQSANLRENATNPEACCTAAKAASTPGLAVCRRVTGPDQTVSCVTSHTLAVLESYQSKQGQDT